MKIPFWPQFKGYRDIELGLDRMLQALARLNNPHKKLPKTIHIAGTNGKGSTLAFLKSILIRNNYKVHSYTSPHLVEFNERIELSNKKIDDDYLSDCLKRCKEICEMEPKIDLTFFEGTTLAAFLAFSETNADFLILETGLGGRLDATNVVEDILAAIITPISIDHAEFLGNNIKKIATEKAGIIKRDCKVILSKQDSEASIAIREANNFNNKILEFGKNFNIKEQEDQLVFSCNFFDTNAFLRNYISGEELKLKKPINLSQPHQIENLATAIATIINCNIKINLNDLNLGISEAYWPARLEKITFGLLYDKIPSKFDFELILDGGHNPAAGEQIAMFLDKNASKNIIIIFSMLADKDHFQYLSHIKSKFNQLIYCPITNSETLKFDEIKIAVSDSNILESGSINDAINASKQYLSSEKENLILICGSLYLVGEFLSLNQPPL